jgi:hypothetical protein
MIMLLVSIALALSGVERDIRPLLHAQGFEWTLAKADTDIDYIGDIRKGRQTYSIYLYNGVNRESGHGLNFFVFIMNRTAFLGVHEAGSAHDCQIDSDALVCKADYPGRRIQFTKNGPPLMLWFDGYYQSMYFAPKFRRIKRFRAVRLKTDPRTVFARHDPQSHLPNTKIRKLGVVRVKAAAYDIYYLDFSNPVSLHGLQQIAIIRNGNQFAGAYTCTLGGGASEGRLFIGKDRLTVKIFEMTFVIPFDEKGSGRNKYFCGEGSDWDNNI